MRTAIMVIRFSLVQLKNSVTLDAPTAYSVYDGLGFRVANHPSSAGTVSKPTSMANFGLGALAVAYRTQRKSKA
jgi:hypothetical protein